LVFGGGVAPILVEYFGGGFGNSPNNIYNVIDYVTISTTGNSTRLW
jgi:hypothetical protein